MDLAGCWIHIKDRYCLKDDPEAGKADDYVTELLGIKDGMRPYCVVAIGYPEQE